MSKDANCTIIIILHILIWEKKKDVGIKMKNQIEIMLFYYKLKLPYTNMMLKDTQIY